MAIYHRTLSMACVTVYDGLRHTRSSEDSYASTMKPLNNGPPISRAHPRTNGITRRGRGSR